MLYLVRYANPQIDATVLANQWQLSAVGIERAHQLAQTLDKAGIQAVIRETWTPAESPHRA